jgi:hypothetical protein
MKGRSTALIPPKLENFAFEVFLLPYERGGGLDYSRLH